MRTYFNCYFILVFCVNSCVSKKNHQPDPVKKYHNYTLYRAIPLEEKHMDFLTNLYEQNGKNFWKEPGALLKSVDFVVAPEDKPRLLAEARVMELILRPIIDDVQIAFDNQTVKAYSRRDMTSFDWKSYYRLGDIYEWLKDLARLYPDEIELKVIGKSHENRNILAVIINMEDCKNRSIVFIEGGIHAREWISPAFVTYLIKEIVRGPASPNEGLRNISKTYEWIFVPVVNPDGYEYTFTKDRLWRKNRRGFFDNVDLNRNFGYRFGTVGVTKDFSKETYCGPHAFSENESKSLAHFIKSKGSRLEYYLNFHSYGQLMIIPYCHIGHKVENFREVKNICTEAEGVIRKRYGTRYNSGNAYDTLGYFISGASGCWVKKRFQVPYVITFELRDDGHDGFALSPEKIIPTCEETLDGLIHILTPKTAYFTKFQNSTIDNITLVDVPMSNSTINSMGLSILFGNVILFILLYIT